MKKLADQNKDLLDGVKNTAMRTTLARLQQTMQDPKHKARIAVQKQIDEAQKKAATNVVQLPLWPEPSRGVPNSALRGSLFASIHGKGRVYMKRQLLAAQQGVEIRFTGMQLDQSDMDVFEQALHLAREHPLGTHCDFTAHAFLKALGRRTGKSDHEWLKDVFSRLAGCAVEITVGNLSYFGSLLEGWRDEETGLYRLEFNPKLKSLFSAGWTAIDWEQRKQLKRKPLAKWLHGFYATHAEPYPITVQKLREWSGSKNKDLYGFKRDLKKALNDLEAVDSIDSYTIDGDLVSVKRSPSNSQKKHLCKGKLRKK